MSKTRIIGKDADGLDGEQLFSILADAELSQYTFAVGYGTESKEWTTVQSIAGFLRFMPYLEVKEYNESMEVPDELVEEIQQKQKEYDERHAQRNELNEN